MAEANYQTPVYVTDENFKPGIVQVILDIPNLKPFKKNQPNAKNANVIYEFHTRSMCITINGNKGKLQNKNYQLDIKRLPGDIEENTSHIKVEENRIQVLLVKADNSSWYPALNTGLETFEGE
ncbi:uncharacterized protein LOC106872334 isoform X1 [Octopus bimaculoides]|uniref:uncharacterized protein LOC106872334 isoform X1 n=1 Tax=Octopus bimaculoides TaxID=37653 RepID=UPI00071CC883|nr:uncharacterized protein LOC106872334 isoform X1 [Octopus bimaculoides]|eukprot:XP_014774766.1 PREDICTED: uncharacterized protein LOC106872334 isoform X1 [Octopus bimaculoides]